MHATAHARVHTHTQNIYQTIIRFSDIGYSIGMSFVLHGITIWPIIIKMQREIRIRKHMFERISS